MTRSLLYVLIFLFSYAASATLNIDFVGGVNSASTQISSTDSTVTFAPKKQSGTGYGVLVGLDWSIFLGLQTGVLMVNRKMSATVTETGGTFTQTSTLKSMQVPALLEFTALPFLTLAGGFVFNSAMGGVQVDQYDPNSLNGGTYNQTQTYSKAGWRQADTATQVSAQLRIPMLIGHLLIAADMQKGLVNMDTSGSSNTKLNVTQFWAGYGIGF